MPCCRSVVQEPEFQWERKQNQTHASSSDWSKPGAHTHLRGKERVSSHSAWYKPTMDGQSDSVHYPACLSPACVNRAAGMGTGWTGRSDPLHRATTSCSLGPHPKHRSVQLEVQWHQWLFYLPISTIHTLFCVVSTTYFYISKTDLYKKNE